MTFLVIALEREEKTELLGIRMRGNRGKGAEIGVRGK